MLTNRTTEIQYDQTASIHQAAQLIREADSLVITAGASMSIDSGLLDFRDGNNFWNTFPELQGVQHGFLGLATERNFTYRSELAWGFYGHCLRLYRAAIPHAGYALLKKWGERMPLVYGVFTSNVDGQFQKAGFDGGVLSNPVALSTICSAFMAAKKLFGQPLILSQN